MASKFIDYENNIHGVAESTMLKATKVGHHYNLEAEVDIDNGSVAKIGEYKRPDVWEAVIPAKEDKIVLILTAPKIYEEYEKKMQEEQYFYNAAGEIMRAYEIQDTDRFSLSEEAFSDDANAEVGKYVVVDETGYKLTTADDNPNADGAVNAFVGKIIDVNKNGTYLINVLRNREIDKETDKQTDN